MCSKDYFKTTNIECAKDSNKVPSNLFANTISNLERSFLKITLEKIPDNKVI